VTATGDLPLSYQWQRNGVNLEDKDNLSGSASNILTINSASSTNAGTYWVIVSNAVDSVVSSSALLNIIPGWALTTAPSDPWSPWSSVASSANGSNLVAVAGTLCCTPGPIYTSTNAGATWIPAP